MRAAVVGNLTFIGKRVGGLLVSLILASLVIFLLLRLLPGDSSGTLLGVGTTQEQLEQLREELAPTSPF